MPFSAVQVSLRLQAAACRLQSAGSRCDICGFLSSPLTRRTFESPARNLPLPEHRAVRWLASGAGASGAPSVEGEGPSLSSQEKPLEPSPEAVKRLLKIRHPGSSRAKGKAEIAASPAVATAAAAAAAAGAEEAAAGKAAGSSPQATEKDEWRKGVNGSGEFGFKYKGPEPTKHGDWAIKGRVSDF
ncbi:hypothetical protein Efla_005245 [Eimeria flavescens]